MDALFRSRAWADRLAKVGIHPQAWTHRKHRLLTWASPDEAVLTPYAPWEWVTRVPPPEKRNGVDLVSFRTLPLNSRPAKIPAALVAWLDQPAFHLPLKKGELFSKSVESRFSRAERRFAKDYGPVSVRVADDTNKVEWVEGWFKYLSQRHPGALLTTPQGRAIVDAWLLKEPLAPWIRLYSLECREGPVAYAWCYRWEGVESYYSPCFDSDARFRKFGTGGILLYKVIQQAAADGLRLYDFLEGDYEYKKTWGAISHPLVSGVVPCSALGRVAAEALRLRKRFSKTLIR